MRGWLKILTVLTPLYGIAACAFALPLFTPAPVFYEDVPAEGQSYACSGGEGPSIFIRFEDEGRTAWVLADKRTVRLPYKTSGVMDDVYESGPWRLTLDPEANFTGPGELRYGNCA